LAGREYQGVSESSFKDRLREQGALTLDLDPRKLTPAVLNQYLTVKEWALV
jgi:hypothetical protein